MNTILNIIGKVKDKEDALEVKAFELYCEREITDRVRAINTLKKKVNTLVTNMHELDEDTLRESFNAPYVDPYVVGGKSLRTPRETILIELSK